MSRITGWCLERRQSASAGSAAAATASATILSARAPASATAKRAVRSRWSGRSPRRQVLQIREAAVHVCILRPVERAEAYRQTGCELRGCQSRDAGIVERKARAAGRVRNPARVHVPVEVHSVPCGHVVADQAAVRRTVGAALYETGRIRVLDDGNGLLRRVVLRASDQPADEAIGSDTFSTWRIAVHDHAGDIEAGQA